MNLTSIVYNDIHEKYWGRHIMYKRITLALMVLSLVVFGFSQKSYAQTEQAMNRETKTIVTDQDAVNSALNVGAKMPSFSLKDGSGKMVSSKDLLKQGNLVIVFYRGDWCPFCNLYLRSLQKRLTDISDAGGKLVAISVENPDASMAVAKKNEVLFTVLSDPKLETARKFKIVYQLPDKTDTLYKSRGLDVAKHNEMERPELPIAATYIVNKKGKIVYAFLDTDYKKRAEPDVIIENLKKLKS
ncbi:MAG: peroxiredoxin-like family protein [Pyrinomonadaceae bacterium]